MPLVTQRQVAARQAALRAELQRRTAARAAKVAQIARQSSAAGGFCVDEPELDTDIGGVGAKEEPPNVDADVIAVGTKEGALSLDADIGGVGAEEKPLTRGARIGGAGAKEEPLNLHEDIGGVGAKEEPLNIVGVGAKEEPLNLDVDIGGVGAKEESLNIGGVGAKEELLNVGADIGGVGAKQEPLSIGSVGANVEPINIGGVGAKEESLNLGAGIGSVCAKEEVFNLDAEEPLNLDVNIGGVCAKEEPLNFDAHIGGVGAKEEPLDLDAHTGGACVEQEQTELVNKKSYRAIPKEEPQESIDMEPREMTKTEDSRERIKREEPCELIKTEGPRKRVKKESRQKVKAESGPCSEKAKQELQEWAMKKEAWIEQVKAETIGVARLKREIGELKKELDGAILEVHDDSSDDAEMLGERDSCRAPPKKAPRLPNIMEIFGELVEEIPNATQAFWLRRSARRRALKRLAEECAKFGPLVRQRAAELRAAAARRRLDLLRAGDLEAYRSAVGQMKESRLQEILEETERIFRDMNIPGGGRGGAATSAVASVGQPAILGDGLKLLEYQLHGMRWLAELFDCGMSGILADDMGLGKTAQTLSLLAFLMESRGQKGPHLVVVPLSVLPHWVDEMRSWTPTMRFVIFRGSMWYMRELMNEMLQSLDTYNITLTTFDTLTLHHSLLSQIPWNSIIIDEGHRLKNFNTRFSHAVRSVPCQHKLLLTGTPLQNSLRELWSLLAFVAPREFGSLADFEQWFALPAIPRVNLADANTELPSSTDGTSKAAAAAAATAAATESLVKSEAQAHALLSEEEELLIIQRLHSVLRPFILRRTKDMVLTDLPEKKEVVIWVPLSPWQQALYHGGLRRMAIDANDRVGPRRLNKATTMSLRKAVNHPYHFLSEKGEAAAAVRAKAENIYRASGKFEFLERFLPRLLKFGHKTLIFAQMCSLLDLLEALLQRVGINFCRIDGSLNLRKRRKAVEHFRKGTDVGVLLLTTRAGGTGLNLQVADTVVLFDSDWNPQVDLQAMDRVHRIGQTRPVRIIRLMTPTSLDKGLVNRSSRKLEMERKVIGAGRFHQPAAAAAGASRAEEEGDLLRRLVRDARNGAKAAAALRDAGCTPLQEVNRLLARSPEELAAFEEADTELLGPAAASEGGGLEGVAERLLRCGRLIEDREVPRMRLPLMAPIRQAKVCTLRPKFKKHLRRGTAGRR